MYLIDTNVWLELFLDQNKAADVRKFFESIEAHLLAITEFSLYSIGIILMRLKKYIIFEDFLSDILESSNIIRIRLDVVAYRKSHIAKL